MKAKQEPPERETFEVKGGKRSEFLPGGWWPRVCWVDHRLWDFADFRQAGSWFGETCCSMIR
ncbi:MAG: hypothetical protein V8R04_09415 [Bacteroides thetaiotaomicron]